MYKKYRCVYPNFANYITFPLVREILWHIIHNYNRVIRYRAGSSLSKFASNAHGTTFKLPKDRHLILPTQSPRVLQSQNWWPVAPEEFNHGYRRIKGPSAALIVCHCFSERLIKARKYGPAIGRGQRCLELTRRMRMCRGWRGPRRVVRYRDEDQRSIVPAVNKCLMILTGARRVLLD